jgi:large subunit ribosomal protein L27
MATKKAGGTAKNLRDSGPQYLGIKVTDGQKVGPGNVIVRQRGTVYRAGKNVGTAKDYSLFALANGTVQFKNKRFQRFDGSKCIKKQVNVL